MISKVIPKASHIEGSFGALRDYIADARKAELVVISNSLLSLDTAAIEMESVAAKNVRVENPAYHFVLSWSPEDRPTHKDMVSASRTIIRRLGLDDQQWISTVHGDTEHPHIHTAANRIHPESYLANCVPHDFNIMDYACRELEIAKGWKPVSGIYEAHKAEDGRVEIRIAKDRVEGNRRRRLAVQYVVWSSRVSFQEWAADEPASTLKSVLADPNISVHDVRLTLARYNLELQARKTGGVVVDRTEPSKLHTKASSMGLDYKMLSSRFDLSLPPTIEEETEIANAVRTSYERNAVRVTSEHDLLVSEMRAEYEQERDARQTQTEAYLKKRWAEVRANQRRRMSEARKTLRNNLEKRLIAEDKTDRRELELIARFAYSESIVRLKSEFKLERSLVKAEEAHAPARRSWRQWLADRETNNGDERAALIRAKLTGRSRIDETGDIQTARIQFVQPDAEVAEVRNREDRFGDLDLESLKGQEPKGIDLVDESTQTDVGRNGNGDQGIAKTAADRIIDRRTYRANRRLSECGSSRSLPGYCKLHPSDPGKTGYHSR